LKIFESDNLNTKRLQDEFLKNASYKILNFQNRCIKYLDKLETSIQIILKEAKKTGSDNIYKHLKEFNSIINNPNLVKSFLDVEDTLGSKDIVAQLENEIKTLRDENKKLNLKKVIP
jgi:hypothetical protein